MTTKATSDPAKSDGATCGEAAIRLLEAYGIDTVFGIPGVHTLELYRGLPNSRIRHVTPRHEQGASFMADGYARVSGRPAACLLTTGPGLTNAATGIAQAYSDSSPMLVLSSVNERRHLGMGRGRLHELRSQSSVLAPLCAFSHTVMEPAELPEVMARAFGVFQSSRPRPVHIEIPLDVLAAPAGFPTTAARARIGRPSACDASLVRAADLIAVAERPVLIVGGGARDCPGAVRQFAEGIGAAVLMTGAAKGTLPVDHPLCLGSSTDQPAMVEFIERADVVIVAGSELAETDFWSGVPRFGGSLIRIDIDPATLTRDSAPDVALLGDAGAILCDLVERLATPDPARQHLAIQAAKAAVLANLPPPRQRHAEVLAAIRAGLPPDGIVMSDMTQIAYAGNSLWPTDRPRTWHHPHGFGTLGFALPAAIGAKLALPDRDVVCLIGDGGLMFTVQDLMTAVELDMPLAVVMWNNDGYGQIRDGMIQRGIPEIGVTLRNPDHLALARAMGCHATRADDAAALTAALGEAFQRSGPTLIEVRQDRFA
ncbi:5-guanidino-2-oxopentanoate decarboxylase [Skermanella stibiiresistens]|uniref:5-guanidino-2-oxopentanoate decarboxylase n=1 Tax=Skermanella stibiiresistens TaxID=913326 RepID=UPI0004AC761B|nr:5-guanidino-2-oxopentanoate decarboxylase [Skermanella stibiiresistens]